MTDDSEDGGQAERNAQAVAAAVGALAGLPFGPVGAVVGAALGPLLEPHVSEVMYLVGQAGKRRGAAALAETCEATDLSVGDTLSRIFNDEKSQLLAATAVYAATRTTWEDKVRTLGRSLASGLLSSDDAEVDTEQLIMSAIADMEAPHLALLDLLVAWHPYRFGGLHEPERLDIPDYSYQRSFDGGWSVGERKWTMRAIQAFRPRLTPVLSSLVGTLQRHGLAFFDDNSDQVIKQLERSAESEANRRDQALRTRNRPRRPTSAFKVKRVPGAWEPTELGEQVWLRFHTGGANVPDVWLQSAPDPPGEGSDPGVGGP